MDNKARERAMQDPMAYPLAQDGGWVGDSTCHGGEWAPYPDEEPFVW